MDNSSLTKVAGLIDARFKSSDDADRVKRVLEKHERRFERADERLGQAMRDDFSGKILVRNGRGFFYDDIVGGILEYPVVMVSDVKDDLECPQREVSSINPDLGMDVLVTLDQIAEGKVTL